MIRNRHCILIKIIYNDLRIYGKVQLFLLLSIIVSAIFTVIVTYQTRCMMIDREKFLLKKEYLENEWNNLILKKEILSDHIRIEHIAVNKLKMDYVNSVVNDICE